MYRWQEVCSTIGILHRDGPLLERAYEELAEAAARAALEGQADFVIPESGSGAYLRSCLLEAKLPPPTDEIWCWLSNMICNVEKFLLEIQPPRKDLTTRYLSREVLESDDFLQIVCEIPTAKRLNISVAQMRDVCFKSDLWRALGDTLAYAIHLSVTHAPKNKKGRKRPGAQELWQVPYLGVVDAFVTGDKRMREAASEVSALMRNPRQVFLSDEFFSTLRAGR